MSSTYDKVKQIIKFVETIYKPSNTKVVDMTTSDREQYVVGFNFEEIPDKYITNSSFRSVKENKEENLTREIRTYVKNYLNIYTTGLQPPDFFGPPEKHSITILVITKK